MNINTADCVLFIESIGEGGEHIKRYWVRSARRWTEHQALAIGEGYSKASVADGQMTRIVNKGIKLPLGETVHAWGWQDLAHPKYNY